MGSIQLWKGYQLSWVREESLSNLHAVEIVDLPEKSIVEGGDGIGAKLGKAVQIAIASVESLNGLGSVSILNPSKKIC